MTTFRGFFILTTTTSILITVICKFPAHSCPLKGPTCALISPLGD